MLQGVYEEFPHHNIGSQLEGRVVDDALWQRCWCRLAAQSESWYATPSGAVGLYITAILAAEWRGFLGRSWNSERPLVFAHVVLTKMLGICRARDIWARITQRIDLWEKGLHAGLVGDAEAEGAAWDGRAASGKKEEDEVVSKCYHNTVLSGKLRQAGRLETNREGGGCLLPDDKCTKTRRPVTEVSGRSTRTCVCPPWKITRAQPSRSMRRCLKWYPSTSRRMT